MAGKSLTPFYIGLGVLAVAGAAFIIRSASGSRQPPLTTETTAPIAPGPRGITMGPDSAPVEIMEFSDFECPYCGQYAQIQMPDIRQRLIPTGKVRWRYLNWPIQGHRNSPYAHLAAMCANEQGSDKFWRLHDMIYEHQEEWGTVSNPSSRLEDYALQAGVDKSRFDACVKDRHAWGRVLADKALGDSLGVGGTPTFFINGHQWTGNRNPTTDQLLVIVDSLTRTAPAQPGARRPAAR
jgi:protein-disulfide isomerase